MMQNIGVRCRGAWALPILAAFSVVTASCGSAGQSAAPTSVTLKTTEFSFSPNAVNLKVGQPVHLTLQNDGALGHDIKSDIPIASLTYQQADNPEEEQKENSANGELDVDFDAHHNGQVTFTPTKAGTYTFYCDVEGHRPAGMQGTFTVSS
jgi:uncharacterized cupredoxin-like copper-binding protein